ncbi:hypothetical protein WDZ92_52395, partial [Nostoc sp. NIES-2111]
MQMDAESAAADGQTKRTAEIDDADLPLGRRKPDQHRPSDAVLGSSGPRRGELTEATMQDEPVYR